MLYLPAFFVGADDEGVRDPKVNCLLEGEEILQQLLTMLMITLLPLLLILRPKLDRAEHLLDLHDFVLPPTLWDFLYYEFVPACS